MGGKAVNASAELAVKHNLPELNHSSTSFGYISVNHAWRYKNRYVVLILACVAGGQAFKDRAGERPPARFGFVFQIPPTSLYFVISQSTNTKYIFNTLTENYFTLDNTVTIALAIQFNHCACQCVFKLSRKPTTPAKSIQNANKFLLRNLYLSDMTDLSRTHFK